VAGTVESVGTALQGDVDRAPAGMPVLRIVGVVMTLNSCTASTEGTLATVLTPL
jgi:hypothetical protein